MSTIMITIRTEMIMSTEKFFAVEWLSVLLLLFVCGFQPTVSADVEQTSSKPTFVLGEGDVLRVFVWNHPNLSLNVPINPNGTINYPLIGELKAAGKTEKEFENMVADKIRNHIKNPIVSVTLMEMNSNTVYVNGEVIHPGLFTVKGRLTASQAIAMAGGFTSFADKSSILIINQDLGRRIHFNFKDFIAEKPGHPDIYLQAGDTVFVN